MWADLIQRYMHINHRREHQYWSQFWIYEEKNLRMLSDVLGTWLGWEEITKIRMGESLQGSWKRKGKREAFEKRPFLDKIKKIRHKHASLTLPPHKLNSGANPDRIVVGRFDRRTSFPLLQEDRENSKQAVKVLMIIYYHLLTLSCNLFIIFVALFIDRLSYSLRELFFIPEYLFRVPWSYRWIDSGSWIRIWSLLARTGVAPSRDP